MEDTCEGKTCYLWELTGGKCFNYIETWWTPAQGGKPVLVKDCAPKRTVLLFQELSNRLIGVEKSQEELRNECVSLQAFAEVIGRSMRLSLQDFVQNRKLVEQRIEEQKKLLGKNVED